MNGKQALPEDRALQEQRKRYKSANTVFAKRAARGWLDCLRHSPRPKHLHQAALSTLSLPAPLERNASCPRTSQGFRVTGGTSLVHLDLSLKFVNGVNGVKGVNVILLTPPAAQSNPWATTSCTMRMSNERIDTEARLVAAASSKGVPSGNNPAAMTDGETDATPTSKWTCSRAEVRPPARLMASQVA